MREQAEKNKVAWEYRAYEFWNNQGSPTEKSNIYKKRPYSSFTVSPRIFSKHKRFENSKSMWFQWQNSGTACIIRCRCDDIWYFRRKQALCLRYLEKQIRLFIWGNYCNHKLRMHYSFYNYQIVSNLFLACVSNCKVKLILS